MEWQLRYAQCCLLKPIKTDLEPQVPECAALPGRRGCLPFCDRSKSAFWSLRHCLCRCGWKVQDQAAQEHGTRVVDANRRPPKSSGRVFQRLSRRRHIAEPLLRGPQRLEAPPVSWPNTEVGRRHVHSLLQAETTIRQRPRNSLVAWVANLSGNCGSDPPASAWSSRARTSSDALCSTLAFSSTCSR